MEISRIRAVIMAAMGTDQTEIDQMETDQAAITAGVALMAVHTMGAALTVNYI